MFARALTPISFAIVTLFSGGPLAIGALTATAVVDASAKAPATPIVKAAVPQQALRQIVLKTGMAGGKMVYLDAQGQANPVLRANVGDTVEITISSGEGAEHDIVIPDLKVHSKNFNGSTGPIVVSLKR